MATKRIFPLLSDVLIELTLTDPTATPPTPVTGATLTYDVVDDQYVTLGITGSLSEVGGGLYRGTIQSTATATLVRNLDVFVKITANSGANDVTSFVPARTDYRLI